MKPLALQILTCLLCASAMAAGEAPVGPKILEGARTEVRKGTFYDGSDYRIIPYPGGDIDPKIGVCTDLIVRAFRNAGYDLQKLLFEDRSQNPQNYPNLWEKKKPDSNIDHRRCQNLVAFFNRHARRLTNEFTGDKVREWQGGDVVFFVYEGEKHPWHVAIVSDRLTTEGVPYVIHLFPPQAAEVPLDTKYLLPIHSHYRWDGKTVKQASGQTKKPSAKKATGSPKPETVTRRPKPSPDESVPDSALPPSLPVAGRN